MRAACFADADGWRAKNAAPRRTRIIRNSIYIDWSSPPRPGPAGVSLRCARGGLGQVRTAGGTWKILDYCDTSSEESPAVGVRRRNYRDAALFCRRGVLDSGLS